MNKEMCGISIKSQQMFSIENWLCVARKIHNFPCANLVTDQNHRCLCEHEISYEKHYKVNIDFIIYLIGCEWQTVRLIIYFNPDTYCLI